MYGEHTGVSSQHLLIFVVASMLVLTLFRKKWAVRWSQVPSLLLLLSSRNTMATLITSRVALIFNPPYSKCQTYCTNTSLSCNLMCELWRIYLAVDPFVFHSKWGALLDAVLATSTTSLYCELHYCKSTLQHQLHHSTANYTTTSLPCYIMLHEHQWILYCTMVHRTQATKLYIEGGCLPGNSCYRDYWALWNLPVFADVFWG